MPALLKSLCITALFFSFVSIANVIHSERSLYRNITVEDQGDIRCLKFHTKQQKSQQSCIYKSNPEQLVFSYTKLLLSALLLNSAPKSIVVIGLGGGTLSNTLHQLLPDANITNVELDGAVTKVARQYFDYFENQQIKTITQDGRIFVKRATLKKQRYDLIILDAFNGDYIPEHLMTVEFLQEIKQILTNDGVLAANTFSASTLYTHESATYQYVFGDFYNVRGDLFSNRIIIAQNKDINASNAAMTLHKNSKLLHKILSRFDVDSEKLRRMMKIEHDWPKNTRLLTDQYSPVNLLSRQ
ncbi:MAG: fused MFS/spermidine synthase [Alteromonadaceae bacterium]|nr:fused MFS/spermidine synthase [Alteromonadaceae bacterium]